MFKKIIIIIGSLILLTRCSSKKADPTESLTPNFSSIYSNILSKNCIQCHEPQGSATVNSSTEINFSSQTLAYQTLVGPSSKGISANVNGQCNNVPLVSAAQPESSYLLATLFSEYNHTDFYKNGCSPYSPDAHGVTLNASEKSAIVTWIQNGALNN